MVNPITERWFYISLSYATFAIVSQCNKIVKTAPIAGWMQGKTLQEIRPYLLAKRAIVKELS